ncbi:hypothetical protein CYLTODRAFT_424232 [Cylindrobasidium torrendii FP15055 ss-10]|uniref:RRM domain-containing protein n=1 Tax=Cylindrobasidium torrendii FP15055 ss-10 TaxID=1314674 RepID=A0A0D7B4Q9_9AGAR|nr:hypothetical protein CYLTODRAFT_424232 [Cylindrobasidium torrendii FP15055 ss-10]
MLRLASLGRTLRSQPLSRLYTSDAPAHGLTHRARVFLGSLPKQTTHAEVEALFSEYKPSVVIVKDHTSLPPQTEPISTPRTSRSKIGFLWFQNDAEAQAVVAAHAAAPFALGNYNIDVKADSGASKQRPPGFEKLNMGMPRSKLPAPTDTLYVSPLPHTVTDADLQAAFAPYGTVARVNIRQLPSQDTEWSFDAQGKRRGMFFVHPCTPHTHSFQISCCFVVPTQRCSLIYSSQTPVPRTRHSIRTIRRHR